MRAMVDGRGRLLKDPPADTVALAKLLAPASDEDRVIDAFRCWLIGQGWSLVAPTDVEAVRGDEHIIGEAKGRTKETGIDADIAYGQLLRRMTTVDSVGTRYALIVPSSSISAVHRVPARIRHVLRLDVFEVTDTNMVHLRNQS
jgi:hypothetical protein